MQFHSAEYAALLIGAAASSWLLRGRPRLRGGMLLGLSLLFYVRWNLAHPARLLRPELFSLLEIIAVCLGLLLFSSFLDFVVARHMAREERPGRRKRLLAASVVLNLGILSTFKYFNFFTAELSELFGLEDKLFLNVLAPMGISFYTFQTISYVVDVYRQKSPPAERYLDYLLYLAFFPQLVMGPIVRAHELLPQLGHPPQLTAEQGSEAVFRIGTGLIKKLAIADFLRAQIVDPVFTNPEMYSSIEALVAMYAYTFQIYADFSGYTDIAIGSARLIGIEIPENFNAPYRARNLREFWQRWHITLSRWLRDYLYIPLGGSRRATWRIYLNLMITMLLGGLWHGAALSFVIWGAIHGLALVATRVVQRARATASLPEKWRSGLGLFFTFHVVAIAWIFFRAPSFGVALEVLGGIFAFDFGADNLPLSVLGVLAAAALTHYAPSRWLAWLKAGFHKLPAPAQAALFIAAVLAAEQISSADVAPFIYSQF